MRHPQLSLIALLLVASGCRNEKREDVSDGPLTEEPAWELALILDADSAAAGEPVGYTVTLLSPEGEAVDPGRWELSSDLEPDLLWSEGDVTATIAGSHTITAAVEIEDEGEIETLTATAELNVAAAAAYDLDLQLSDYSADAGEPLAWAVVATDAYGNEVDASAADVSVDPDEVTVDPGELWGVTPGTYLAVASLSSPDGDLYDSEVFVIVPGPAAEITLEMDTALERFETAHATVSVTDSYGNPTADPWTLTVDGAGSVDLSYANLTFYDEGWYTVTATVDGTTLSDSVGPFLIDSTGPALTIDSPERGQWNEGYAGTVSGTVIDEWSSGLTLTVDGASVTPDAGGAFSTSVAYDFGLNIVETSAIDGDGNAATDTRAVLAGEFLEYGEGVEEAVSVRINEGSGGLDTLEALGEGLVSATDLDALIPSPVYSNESEDCYNPCVWWDCTVCVTWYSVDLYVKNPQIGSTDLDLDPLSSGRIKATFTVNDPSLDWSGSGVVAEVGYSGSGDITADKITVTMELRPYVSNGNIGVLVYNVDASTTNFDFDMDGWLYDVIDFFGVDVDGWVEGYMTDAIETAVYDQLPGVFADALQDLELDFSFAVLDNSYAVLAEPSAISVDSAGLTLSLSTTAQAASWVHAETGLGSLYGGYAVSTWASSPGSIVGVSSDFLNQVLFALWGGGALDMTVDSEELGLDPADLAFLFPDLTSLTVAVDPLLPPVAVPSSGASPLQLQVGDLALTLYNGPVEAGDQLLQVYVSALADMDVSLGGAVDGEQTLSAQLGAMTLYFDVVYPEANTAGAADTEALLQALVPLVLPSLTDGLGQIEIPSIQGFTLSGITTGSTSGYLTLGGNLVED